jgi:hypothetical protein
MDQKPDIVTEQSAHIRTQLNLEQQPIDLVLCGQSLFMAGLEASLGVDAALRVIRLDTSLAQSGAELQRLHPGTVIFETNPENLQYVTELMNTCPGISLLGLDTERNTIAVYSCKKQEMVSARELRRLILGES